VINQAILKKTFIIFFILLIAGVGAFYYFDQYQHKKIDSWQLVPANAIIAYENSSLIDNWNRIIDKKVWETLKKVPYFGQWEAGLTEADSLSGKNGSLDRLFRNRRFIVSVHIISSDQFDFLFNLDLNDQSGKNTFDQMIRNIQQDYDLIAKSRSYLGFELKELERKSDMTTFTYFIYENVLVGSYTSFLVEDVVRNVSNGFQESFQGQISALQGISRLENDEGNIYIDYARLPDLFATLLLEQPASDLKNFARFSGDTYLDVKITDDEILLNGVTTVDLASNKSFVGTFKNQNPGRIKLTSMLPNTTAVLYHVYFSNFKEWQSQLTKFWSATNKEQLQKYLDFEQKYELKLDWFSGEAANAILETPNREKPDQLVLIGITDQDAVFNELSTFAQKLGEEQNDSVYFEVYNDLPILQLPYQNFPAMLMGEYFSGFENSFVTIYNEYLILGNSMQAVKSFLNAIENEDNWGKSVRQSIFLENTLSEASFSMMVNTGLCWEMLTNHLNPRWAGLFSSYENSLKSFDLLSIQISNLDQRFYTSIAVGHKQKVGTKPHSTRLEKQQSVFTLSPLITKPFIVKNHNNNRFEVLVQDSSKILYLVSNEGEILWGDSLKQAIVTDILQVDYYKNRKLQYLFATRDQLHLLDRNGDYVENYPITFKKGVEAQFLSVIDYDNSRAYRFMVVDSKGNIHLYDKSGKNLEGWMPRKLDAPLAVSGFHVRVRGGDCMIALQSNGVLNVMNRRGETYPGFPLDLKVSKVSNIFVSIGNDFNTTGLITISEEGELIEVNLKGKILKREQLYKPTKESKFWLVNDALKKTFVIARQEYNKISFLNSKGDLLFENSLISSGTLSTQYYNFDSDHQVFAVLDPEQEFAYLYDQTGKQFTFEPLECSFPIGLLYSTKSGEYQLYKCYNNNLTLETFK
jgi:hypothetical protein